MKILLIFGLVLALATDPIIWSALGVLLMGVAIMNLDFKAMEERHDY